MTARVFLLDSSNVVSPESVLAISPAGAVFACDFYVTGVERGEEVPGGYRVGRLLNVDHHGPTTRMARRVSSANLAIDQVRAAGTAGPHEAVVINHTDCDSVLSSAIISGELDPDPRLGQAAIAADHTGAPDEVADLLQALDRARDRDLSLRNLRLLLAGHALEQVAGRALAQRRRKRDVATQAVRTGRFTETGGVTWAVLDEGIDGEFFPALLPRAVVILVAIAHVDCPGVWEVKLRLGMAARDGLTLHALRVRDFDPHYGGRWNAGSNRRAGGTPLHPERYVAEVANRLGGFLRPS
jgi:hypothetical protein